MITANTDRHIILCHIPYINWLKQHNFRVDIGTNTDNEIVENTNKINLNLSRSPFSIRNIKAIFKLKKILDENDYSIIHTHTPVGSVVTRLAYKFSKSKAKIIYTCHGFHFYKGSPLHYWIMFFPIEKYLMKYTDQLLVMNKEDYEFAKKHFKNTNVRIINGAGFNKDRLNKKYEEVVVEKIYQENNMSKDCFIVSYIAEFSNRKRQIDLIEELAKTDIRNSNVKILLIGDDILEGKVQERIKIHNLENSIKTINFTKDIGKYLDISDLVISASKQEGLPLNIMEAIYKRKFIVASNCRGNVDLIENGVNGFLINSLDEMYPKILYVKNNYDILMKNYRRGINISEYDSEHLVREVAKIYKKYIRDININKEY